MRRGIVLEDCRFTDNVIAISVPEGAQLRASGTIFERNGEGIFVRDGKELEVLSFEEAKDALLRLLPAGMTWEELSEALKQIRAASPVERQQQAARTSIASKLASVGKWSLEAASQIVTIAEFFEKKGWL